jgi:hypothetical protein
MLRCACTAAASTETETKASFSSGLLPFTNILPAQQDVGFLVLPTETWQLSTIASCSAVRFIIIV